MLKRFLTYYLYATHLQEPQLGAAVLGQLLDFCIWLSSIIVNEVPNHRILSVSKVIFYISRFLGS